VSTDNTLYELAGEEMERLIAVYLELAEASSGLSALTVEHLADLDARRIILAGYGASEEASHVTAAFTV
jgi:hypothetical protein